MKHCKSLQKNQTTKLNKMIKEIILNSQTSGGKVSEKKKNLRDNNNKLTVNNNELSLH